jgi:hypothetical protein
MLCFKVKNHVREVCYFVIFWVVRRGCQRLSSFPRFVHIEVTPAGNVYDLFSEVLSSILCSNTKDPD